MSEKRETRTGREGRKGDLLVHLEKRTAGGVSIEIESTVGDLYRDRIGETAASTLAALGVQHCRLSINDAGAFDYVIMARIEAAARRLYTIEEPGCLPPKTVSYGPPRRERLRRTRLYMPGNNPDLMYNGGLFGADSVILDLEDSVAPFEKDAARILVRNTLLCVDYRDCERIVRINPLATEYGAADLEAIVPHGVETILIPKCEQAQDVRAVEEIAARIERRVNLGYELLLMPLLETARGVLAAYEIAAASERVIALCFGAEDFTADIGVERTREGTESFTARGLIVLGARAAGVQALDTVFSDIKDEEGLVAGTREAQALGFDGKGIIHPAQIEPVHGVFSPTPERIEYARKVVAAIEKARAQGSGVATLGSKMIDAPIEARARKILGLAEALGLIEGPRARRKGGEESGSAAGEGGTA